MTETIEVRYRLISDPDNSPRPYYHKYIIYTDSNGTKFIARGGPSPQNLDFGPLSAEWGLYHSGHPDWDDANDDPRETIASGSDLSADWGRIKDAIEDIDAEGYSYGPVGQNSNATVDEALDRAGLPEAQLDDTHWSPGTDFPLFFPYVDVPRLIPSWVPNVSGPFSDGEGAPTGGGGGGSYCPLVLDVDGSGTIELAALNGTGSVMWDFDQDDFLEASGWITGGDGLLCIDLNSDGIINDQGELFGGTNGYITLDAYDTNNDNTITSTDTQFNNLLVWIDSNADGYSQSAELHTLTSLGITSITTTYSNVNYTIAGNQISYESTFVMNGNTYKSVDAFFAYDPTNTVYAGDYTLDVRTLFLPTLRGYGDLPDLHIAMSLDETLLTLVQDFAELDASEMIASVADFDGGIQDIMFRWAGVDAVSSTSRGTNIDARHLEFLEAFMGRPYLQGGLSNPTGAAAPFIMEAWHNAYSAVAARLLFQTRPELFLNDPIYNPVSDTFEGTPEIDFSAVESFIYSQTGLMEQSSAARLIIFAIDHVLGIDNLSTQDYDDLQDLMPLGLSPEGLANAVFGNATLSGGAGDELIFAGLTDEILNGNGGNDILVGHDGYDVMYGGTGSDTYVFNLADGYNWNGNNPDQVNENLAEGTDQIVFTAGINADDLRLWTLSSGNLVINYDGAYDLIEIKGGVTGGAEPFATTVDSYLEKIVFDDGTVWDLTTGLHIRNNDIPRHLYGSTHNDTIEGGADNDTLYGYSGNDILVGHDGYDVMYGGTGSDTYVFNLADGYNWNGNNPDQVNENLAEGTDQIVFTAGINADDLRLWTLSSGNLVINYDGAYDLIEIKGGVTGGADPFASTVGSYLEQIVFDDTTTWNLTSGLNLRNNDTGRVMYGSANGDTIEGGAGNDTLYGYGGIDTLSYKHAAAGVTVNLATLTSQNTVGAGTDTISGFENVVGSAYNDTLTGDGNANVIEGGAGNDTLNGGGGTDTLSYENAGAGITLNLATTTAQNTGGAGTDTISNFENLRGSAYNDTLTGTSGSNVIEGGAGNDTINGQGGTDTLSYANAAGAVTVSLAIATAQNTVGAGTDTISSMENLTGSAYGDTLTGSTAANTINGGDGDDTIEGGAGNDTLTGGSGTDTVSYANAGSAVTVNLATTSGQNTVGAGTDTTSGFENLRGSAFNDTLTGNSSNNTIEGGAGNDTINGSGGTDTLSYANAGSAVTVNLSTGTAQNTGGAGTDTISSMENLIGSAYNDTLTGTSSANTIQGGAGADTISAGGGADFLYGGAGADTLTGSTGGDAFIFEAATALGASDTITDFSTAQVDKLDVSDILSAYDPLSHAISDFIRITDNGTHSFLSVDADGGGDSFTQIAQLSSVTNLAAGATATEIELQAMITAGTLVV